MTIIRVTKEFRYEASHMLKDYEGLCANNHGHSYILLVTVSGNINENKEDSKLGMVMDFGDLKDIVYEEIIDKFDHSFSVSDAYPEEFKEKLKAVTGRIHFLPFQPTCENLTLYFAGLIKKRLPPHLKLYSLRLHETNSSYTEWFAEDNPDS